MGQNRLMLLIVINHKRAKNEQPGKTTADNLARQIKIPESPHNGNHQKKCCG